MGLLLSLFSKTNLRTAVFRVLRPWIDQHQRSLEIVDQRLVRLAIEVREETLKKALGLVGIAFCLQQNEGFPQLHMARTVHVELPNDHGAAKDQEHQE